MAIDFGIKQRVRVGPASTNRFVVLTTIVLPSPRARRRLGAATEDKGLRMMREAKRTADSEREEKAILCQWLNG